MGERSAAGVPWGDGFGKGAWEGWRDGVVTTACACPARDTAPRDPAVITRIAQAIRLHWRRVVAVKGELKAVEKCSHVYRVFVGSELRRGG
jgi:hypothetical protein